MRSCPFIFACVLMLGAVARAEDRLWSAVLVASNVAQPKDPPAELLPVIPRLKRVFGYNQFEVLGTDVKPVSDGAGISPVPTKNFWMNIKARRTSVKQARGGYVLNLELYQDERPLVDTIAVIAPESPLFFRGPMHARGQILIVLQIVPEPINQPSPGAIKASATK